MSVAIIGWGWRTPLGAGIDEALARLLAGERAVRPNARFDASSYACRLACTIPFEPAASKHTRFLRRMGLFALEAAHDAARMAGISGGDCVGVFCGYGGLRAHWDDMMPALRNQTTDRLWANGLKLLPPFWMLHHLSNNAHALLAIDLGARGDGVTCGGTNAGAQALGSAIRALEARSIDSAIVTAYDSLVEPETLVELAARGAACESERAPPAYDRAARGLIPGEAAAALVLVRESDRRPGARPLAWIDVADGAGKGKGEADAQTLASVARRVAQSDAVVDGASLALRTRDAAEREAIAPLVARDAALTSISGATGAIGAAAPLVQAITLASLLSRGVLPGIAGLDSPAPGALRPLARNERTTAKSALGVSAGAPGLAGAIHVAI